MKKILVHVPLSVCISLSHFCFHNTHLFEFCVTFIIGRKMLFLIYQQWCVVVFSPVSWECLHTSNGSTFFFESTRFIFYFDFRLCLFFFRIKVARLAHVSTRWVRWEQYSVLFAGCEHQGDTVRRRHYLELHENQLRRFNFWHSKG